MMLPNRSPPPRPSAAPTSPARIIHIADPRFHFHGVMNWDERPAVLRLVEGIDDVVMWVGSWDAGTLFPLLEGGGAISVSLSTQRAALALQPFPAVDDDRIVEGCAERDGTITISASAAAAPIAVWIPTVSERLAEIWHLHLTIDILQPPRIRLHPSTISDEEYGALAARAYDAVRELSHRLADLGRHAGDGSGLQKTLHSDMRRCLADLGGTLALRAGLGTAKSHAEEIHSIFDSAIIPGALPRLRGDGPGHEATAERARTTVLKRLAAIDCEASPLLAELRARLVRIDDAAFWVDARASEIPALLTRILMWASPGV